MKQINFIFTKNGFHLDETKEENTSSWAILFKKYKYSTLYELGFENNLKGLTPNVIKLRDDEPSRYYCLDGIFI